MIRLIALRELRSLFAAPGTWLILGVLQFILALVFLGRLDEFLTLQAQLALVANAPGATQAIIPYFFNVAALVLLMLTPVFTMRLLAEERRSHTLALLMSAPVSAAGIVLGKFAGLLAFLWLIVLGCAAMAATLMFGTVMDTGLLLANACGLLLLAAGYAALGLYCSALAAQPVIAAVGAMTALLGLWLAESGASDSYRIWQALTPSGHFHNFNSGLLDARDLAYYLLFCAFFLLLTIRRLETGRAQA